MTIDTSIAALTQSTSDLLTAVNVRKATQDASMSASIALAATQASAASGSAAQALAIYGSTAAQQAAVAAAQSQASLAAGYAASAASVVTQDLSGVTAQALHRSPNAVTAMFVYDTSKDSDAGTWTEKCQNTSWFNEPLNGKWLGAHQSETSARYYGATVGPELVTNGSFADTSSWTAAGGATLSALGGVLSVAGASGAMGYEAITTEIGATYKVSFLDLGGAINNIAVYTASSGGTLLGASNNTIPNGDIPYVFTFVATGTTSYLRLVNASGVTAQFATVSVKKVTAVNTATGDYFQLNTDGKFYKLNATSGTTEVFRGNKAKFPKLSAIIGVGGSGNRQLLVYDLTEAGRPFWGVLSNKLPSFSGTNGFTAITALNGIIAYSQSAGYAGFALLDLPKARLTNRGDGYGGNSIGIYIQENWRVADTAVFNFLVPSSQTSFVYGIGIVSVYVNAVAMTVLPDAPLDPATGLQVPTIACGTAGGVSVIKHDGTVVSSSSTAAHTKILIDEKEVGAVNASGFSVSGVPGGLGASFAMIAYTVSSIPALMGVPTVMA